MKNASMSLELFNFKLRVYNRTNEQELGLKIIEETQLDFIDELEQKTTTYMAALIHGMMQAPVKSIDVCIKMRSEAGSFGQALVRYLDKLIEDYIGLTDRMLNILTGVVLDKASEYRTLVAVLSLIADVNLSVTKVITARNDGENSPRFETQHEVSLSKAKDFYQLALETSTNTLENHE